MAEIDEKDEVINSRFMLPWTPEHFKYNGSEYACKPCSLTRDNTQTLRTLSRWVDKFATRLKKIDCRNVPTAEAESPAALTTALGRFLYL